METINKIPTIYLCLFAFVFLIVIWVFTRERELLLIASPALGAVIGIATDKKRSASQEVETQNVITQNIPGNIPPPSGGGLPQ